MTSPRPSARALAASSVLVGAALGLSTVLRMTTTFLSARWAAVDDFGTYTTVNGAAALVSAIAMGGWPSYLLAVVPKHGLTRRVVRQMKRGLGVASIVWILGQSVFLWLALEGPQLWKPISAGAVLAIGLIFGTTYNEAQRASGNVVPSRFAIACVPPGVTVGLLLVAAGVNSEISSTVVIGAHAAGWIALWAWANRALRGRYVDDPGLELVVSRRDLFVTKLCQSFLATSDIVAVGWLLGPESAAHYAVASRVAVSAGLGHTAVVMAIGPDLSRSAGQPTLLRHLVRRMTALAFGITVVLAASIIALRDHLLPLFGDDYDGAGTLLIVLVLGVSANALCGPVSLLTNVTGQEHKTRRTLLSATLIYLVIMPVACRMFGVLGAAWAWALTTTGWNVALWLQVDLAATQPVRQVAEAESLS